MKKITIDEPDVVKLPLCVPSALISCDGGVGRGGETGVHHTRQTNMGRIGGGVDQVNTTGLFGHLLSTCIIFHPSIKGSNVEFINIVT